MSVEMTNELKMKLRGQGFLSLKEEGFFSVRALMPAGVVPANISRKITEISEKYGRGYYLLTQRLNIEIPFIKYEDLEKVKAEIESVGAMVGGAGKRVRAVHACKGTVCRFGLYDVESLTKHFMEKIYKGYYDVTLPNKFRIGVSGCPNSCSKPQLTDVGLVGKKLGKVDIFIGGIHGRIMQLHGNLLVEEVTLEQAESCIHKAIDYYRKNGEVGERFPKMIQRIGLDKVKEALLSN